MIPERVENPMVDPSKETPQVPFVSGQAHVTITVTRTVVINTWMEATRDTAKEYAIAQILNKLHRATQLQDLHLHGFEIKNVRVVFEEDSPPEGHEHR